MNLYLIGCEVKHTHKVQRRQVQEWDGRRWQFCGYMENLQMAERYVNNDEGNRFEYRITELKIPKMIKQLI